MKIYKIRDKKTGLFSTGGRYVKWNETGKTWSSKENAQKAIDWYTKDEKLNHENSLKRYKEECDHIKKHNEKLYNIKSGNMWVTHRAPVKRYVPFYKNSEIVEFEIKENQK